MGHFSGTKPSRHPRTTRRSHAISLQKVRYFVTRSFVSRSALCWHVDPHGIARPEERFRSSPGIFEETENNIQLRVICPFQRLSNVSVTDQQSPRLCRPPPGTRRPSNFVNATLLLTTQARPHEELGHLVHDVRNIATFSPSECCFGKTGALPTIRAGKPTARELGGIVPETTEFAPTIAPSPI